MGFGLGLWIGLGLGIVVYKQLEKVTKCGSIMRLKLTNGVPPCRSAPLRQNNQYKYFMGNYKLEPVTEERDLGILITDNLKLSKQCQLAYCKASKALGLIGKTISYRNKDYLVAYTRCWYDPISNTLFLHGLHITLKINSCLNVYSTVSHEWFLD